MVYEQTPETAKWVVNSAGALERRLLFMSLKLKFSYHQVTPIIKWYITDSSYTLGTFTTWHGTIIQQLLLT